MIIHIVILTLITAVFANFKVRVEDVLMKKDTIILVDASDSTSISKDKIDDYIEEILLTYDNPNKVGIVTFGNNCEYVANLSSDAKSVLKEYKNYSIEHKTDATNIEAALKYSQSILKSNGRIIILTDGIETDGDALVAAGNLASKKIQIDAVFFGNTPVEKEIQINGLDVTGPVSLDSETDITVTLQSMSTGEAKLKLYDTFNGVETLIGEQQLFVHENETIVTFKHQFADQGDHFLYVTLETSAGDDTYIENNKYYSFVNISLDTKLLLIDGTGRESEALYNFLDSDYTLDRVSAANVSTDIQVLKQYNQIILMNASMETLPANFDVVLEEYISIGGNVLTTGGMNTYYYGKMNGTKFDDFLPINVIKEEETPIAIMIVMDNSSSMKANIGKSTRMDVAKQSAIEAVGALRDCDYVGLITFDANAKRVIPITPATMRDSIISDISRIEVGQGTNYTGALKMANNELISFGDADVKHVIFISDGEPQDAGYQQYVAGMYEKGITTSTIAIGSNTSFAKLEEIAEIGGGSSYAVTTGYELSKIMIEEIESLQSDYLNQKEDLAPRIRMHTAVVRGISSLPTIDGYIGASAKDDATVVLTVNGDPLYAEWEYGSGKVASFMSDIGGSWAGNYLTDERGKTFVSNVVKNLLSSSEMNSEFEVEFARENFTNVINVNTSSNNGKNKVEASIIYPNGDMRLIELKLVANNEYAAQIPSYGQEGLYRVNLIKTQGKTEIIESFHTTFSYSMEYNAFNDYEESYEFIEKLAKSGKGKVYTLEDDVFAHEIIYDDLTYNPQLGLVILALILFLLDICVRKFNFKWPHEIWGKKKKTEEALI